jgi:hypothetical protein
MRSPRAKKCWGWWCTTVIPVLGRLRQEANAPPLTKFEANLDNIVKPCVKKTKHQCRLSFISKKVEGRIHPNAMPYKIVSQHQDKSKLHFDLHGQNFHLPSFNICRIKMAIEAVTACYFLVL